MTAVQILFLIVVLAGCCAVIVWLLRDAQLPQTRKPTDQINDREQIAEMLTKVKDQSTLSVYKKVYDVPDEKMPSEENE